jgi:hypothetical protein
MQAYTEATKHLNAPARMAELLEFAKAYDLYRDAGLDREAAVWAAANSLPAKG